MVKSFTPVIRLLCCVLFTVQIVSAQNRIDLLKSVSSNQKVESYLRNEVSDIKKLKLRSAGIKQIHEQSPNEIIFSVPIDSKESIDLLVKKNNILAKDFLVTEATNAGDFETSFHSGKHYIGKIEGEENSFAAISVFDEEIMAVFSYKGSNYNLEKSRKIKGTYLLYQQKDVLKAPGFECHSVDNINQLPLPDGVELKSKAGLRNSVVPTVEIYLECDYKMYLDQGSSTSNTVNFTTGLFNVVAGIFDGAQTDILLSEIKVWTVADPYGATTIGSSSGVLANFQCNLTEYNGRVAHLLSTSSSGLGGIAQLPYCPTSGEYTSGIYGFSNISNYYDANLNNYTWTVNVLAHELGHNLGSPHTHACFWNGNNTSIDDCGNKYYDDRGITPEGDNCYNPSSPKLPSEGTVMSYCHLLGSVGIDLSTGFHTQVANQINTVSNCLSSSVGCTTASVDDLFVSNLTASTIRLNCSITQDIWFYYWGYKETSSSTWTYSPNSTSENYFDINIVPNKDYEFVIVLYCANVGWSSFSCAYQFFTGESSCEDNMDVSYVPIPSDVYEANISITSAGSVAQGNSVIFDAVDEIILQPNFEVQLGSVFEAVTADGCGGANNFTQPQAKNIAHNGIYQTGILDRGYGSTLDDATHAAWYVYQAPESGGLKVKLNGNNSRRIWFYQDIDSAPSKRSIIPQLELNGYQTIPVMKGGIYYLEIDDKNGNDRLSFEFKFDAL